MVQMHICSTKRSLDLDQGNAAQPLPWIREQSKDSRDAWTFQWKVKAEEEGVQLKTTPNLLESQLPKDLCMSGIKVTEVLQ